MKAVVYEGPRQVSVQDVPDARIERPTDALVRITTTNICGSDLHMYEGRTDFEPGRWFGHENMGQVIEVGDGVDKIRVGDWVVLPFNIACGHCKNCERQLTNYCLTAQPEQRCSLLTSTNLSSPEASPQASASPWPRPPGCCRSCLNLAEKIPCWFSQMPT